MIRKILIVDDNQEILLSLKAGLEDRDKAFSILTAGDGLAAIKILEESPISLVITDLKMPRMNGFSLLAHMVEHFPDIPVIVMTGYGTANIKKQAQLRGALEYVEKPVPIQDLAKKINTILKMESEGGILHGISAGMFVQLMEMERKTCTIRLDDKRSHKRGILFIREGDLIDARTGGLKGAAAAYEIFSWEEANLSIQNSCPKKKKSIDSDLQAILLEAMRLKDEQEQDDVFDVSTREEREKEEQTEIEKRKDTNPADYLKTRLDTSTRSKWGLENIDEDSSWNSLVEQMMKVGTFFEGGKLNLVYVDKGESNDFILLPGQETTVISVSPKCPREKIIQILNE